MTLITTGSVKIIVDTGLCGEDRLIMEALARKGLTPGDIDLLVNTHSHPDHIGNNHLFSKAKLLHPKEGDIIASGVFIIETPGHTLDSISVVATMTITGANGKRNSEKISCNQATEVIVIAGDALPIFNNYLKEVPPALHIDRELAVSSMFKILRIADIVIPGHDLPFSVSQREYIKLQD